MRLTHVAALMLLQGMPLGQLFDNCAFTTETDAYVGSYIILQGQLTPFYDPIPRVRHLILAVPQTYVGDLNDAQFLAALLKESLPNR
jgi:hypothetical protein